jgi:hypothetical protein
MGNFSMGFGNIFCLAHSAPHSLKRLSLSLCLAMNSPAFSPASPHYDPTDPAFTPTSPHYHDNNDSDSDDYAPQSPLYAESTPPSTPRASKHRRFELELTGAALAELDLLQDAIPKKAFAGFPHELFGIIEDYCLEPEGGEDSAATRVCNSHTADRTYRVPSRRDFYPTVCAPPRPRRNREQLAVLVREGQKSDFGYFAPNIMNIKCTPGTMYIRAVDMDTHRELYCRFYNELDSENNMSVMCRMSLQDLSLPGSNRTFRRCYHQMRPEDERLPSWLLFYLEKAGIYCYNLMWI